MLAQEQDWADPSLSPNQLYDDNPSPTVTLEDLGLLTARDAKRPVGDLSVGQQRRVALALVVADPPDILLLDEPTNHLSVDLIEEVQDAIAEAEGTIIVVTHDRRMVDRLEARHLVVEEGEVTELPRGKKPRLRVGTCGNPATGRPGGGVFASASGDRGDHRRGLPVRWFLSGGPVS